MSLLEFRQSTKQFLGGVTVSYISVIVGIASLFQSLWPAFVTGVFALILVGAAQYHLTYRPSVHHRDKQLNSFFEDYLNTMAEDVEEHANEGVEVRCNIMRPISDTPFGDEYVELSFTADGDDYRLGERDLEFKPGQGCAGAVYRQGRQQIAVRKRRGEWSDGFEMTPAQHSATEHLQVVIGTPVYRSGDDPAETNPAAVLIIDSTAEVADVLGLDEDQSMRETDLKNTEVCNLAADYSTKLGTLL